MTSYARRKAERAAAKAAGGEGTERRGAEPNGDFDELARMLAADQGFADAWDAALGGDHSIGDTTDDGGGTDDEDDRLLADDDGLDATRDVSDPEEKASKVERGVAAVVALCRAAGHTGVTASDIRAELIREKIVKPAGTTQYSRIVKAAMMAPDPAGRIHQPGGPRKRYYLFGFGTGRTQ
jgi:hypothetical protein